MVEFLKQHWFTLAFVVVLAAVVFIPPAAHHYVYPSGGDDTARHLAVIDRIEFGQFSYLADDDYHRYGGQTLVGWLRDLSGVDTDTFFLWFHFGVLFLMGLVVYAVVLKLAHSQVGAALAAALALFGGAGTMILSGCGTVFNLLALYVFGLPALLALAYWLAGKGKLYGLLALLGFAWCGVMHSVTAVYMAVAVPLALAGCGAYRLAKHQSVRSLLVWGVAFIPVGWVLPYLALRESSWIVENALTTDAGIVEVVGQRRVSWFLVEHPSIQEYVVMIVAVVVVAALLVAALVWMRGRVSWQSETRYMLGILGAFGLLMAAGTWLPLSPDNYRFAVDLSIMLALIVGLSLAVVVAQDARRLLAPYAVPLVVGVCLPLMVYWCSYNSCVRGPDLEAFEYLNANVNGESVEVPSQIAPWIYGRFTSVEYVDNGGDLVLWRSEPMSEMTSPDASFFWRDRVTDVAEYEGMPLLAAFSDGTVEVRVYAASGDSSNLQ